MSIFKVNKASIALFLFKSAKTPHLLHVVITRYEDFSIQFTSYEKIKYFIPLRSAMKKNGIKLALFTFVALCISHFLTHDEVDGDYLMQKPHSFAEFNSTKNVSTDNEAEETNPRINLSIGEDLESFLERIRNDVSSIPEYDEYKRSFDICLLRPEEIIKLEQKDKTFMNTFANWGEKWIIQNKTEQMDRKKSEKRFSKKLCWRKSLFMITSSNPFVQRPIQIEDIRAKELQQRNSSKRKYVQTFPQSE